MYKRMIALVLSLLLIVSILPVSAAASTDEVQQIRSQISSDYRRALRATGKSSLNGYCGLMTSWQLYLMGVNRNLIVKDGKNQYDAYCNLEYTTGGYKVRALSARDYSLKEALNTITQNGTRDVYNLLVGFNWTSTSAGRYYGHAVVIYAIIDGVMYFTEGFPSTMCGYAGGVIACSFDEFVDYYDDWTRYEGLVLFGKKDYVDSCKEYASHMFVEATETLTVSSQPCAPGTDGAESKLLRTVISGERLLVTGLYENFQGQHYYRIDDSGTEGYVPADQVSVLRFNFEDVTISGQTAPHALEEGQDHPVSGKITSRHNAVSAVHMTVTDDAGKVALSHSLAKKSGVYDLENDSFSKAVDFSYLNRGCYTYSIHGDIANHYVQDGKVLAQSKSVCLLSTPFWVGEGSEYDYLPETQWPQTGSPNGWFWKAGTWYYYEEGAPRTGWFCDNGVDYYLRQDGSVTTGWAYINGKARFFSDTGAMRTGWIETQEGTSYLLNNGEAAHGWRTIDEKHYYFDENGIMQKDCWLTQDSSRYYLLPDGSAAVGWVDLEEGRFCFHADGHLLAQVCEEDGKTFMQAYHTAVGTDNANSLSGIRNLTAHQN